MAARKRMRHETPFRIREGIRLSRSGGRRLFVFIAIEVDIKEPRVGGSI